MRALFINSKRSDYLQDILYTGMCKVLGVKNIQLSQANWKYFLPYKAYPKGLGYTSGALQKHLFKKLKNFDLVILAAAKRDVLEQYVQIANKIPPAVKVFLIDGGDEAEIGGDFNRLNCVDLYEKAMSQRPFDWVFKREMLCDKTYASNCSPLPFAFNLDWRKKTDKLDKKYEVAFWAVASHPQRAKALELIQDRWDCKANGTGVHPSIKEYKRVGTKYLEELGACKIALNIRGSGWDTLRYWEIPAMGALQLGPKPGIQIPHNFEHEKEAIFCRESLEDLTDLCDYYLKNERLREKIANAGQQKIDDFHQDRHRAEEVLRKV